MNDKESDARTSRRLVLRRIGIACGAMAITGCSLGVMAGKMLKGDPLTPADFKSQTKEDLTKGKSTVLVICTAPDSVDSDYSTLAYDLIDGITRRLKARGVKVIDPDLVAGWIDEHGSSQAHPVNLAQDFETDYVVFIEVHGFSFREPNSPKLLRGQSSGMVKAYEINEIDGRPHASQVFVQQFKSTYPEHQPVSEQGHSSVMFQQEYKDRICVQLAEMFYDHRPGTNF